MITTEISPIPSNIAPMGKETRSQSAAAARKRRYARTATPERILRVRQALPDMSEEALMDDFKWHEDHVGLLEKLESQVAYAKNDQRARILAAGFNRESWTPLCKVGPRTPALIKLQIDNMVKQAGAAGARYPDAMIHFVLIRDNKSESCCLDSLDERFSDGWSLCGFNVTEDDLNIYAVVPGPCSNRAGAVGMAHIVAIEMSYPWDRARCPVLLPDGTYFDSDDFELWENFPHVLNSGTV
jgi:hypothetical protein